MPEIRVILRRGGGRSTREASRDYLDLEERRSSSPTKQASAQDLTVQFPSEFTQIPVPFPQVSCAVGYCIISCFPLGTTQWCR
ncbi:hypothetical protein K443DRAFT_135612 [Laccaria amethystina LaAM-08-1]|uniref:Unplaced genomic scaffold K443scaffold_567, whole genome shotgun sequence n=1 Tax=Laccaria amethystina LaAM-08-1 TaxID=1095629 RepID=A0A0C9WHA2_9AGAR|nr:hypothetical protein K443DRAFT_135612 [Laccaria amethystina LaAM-08-1]